MVKNKRTKDNRLTFVSWLGNKSSECMLAGGGGTDMLFANTFAIATV